MSDKETLAQRFNEILKAYGVLFSDDAMRSKLIIDLASECTTVSEKETAPWINKAVQKWAEWIYSVRSVRIYSSEIDKLEQIIAAECTAPQIKPLAYYMRNSYEFSTQDDRMNAMAMAAELSGELIKQLGLAAASPQVTPSPDAHAGELAELRWYRENAVLVLDKPNTYQPRMMPDRGSEATEIKSAPVGCKPEPEVTSGQASQVTPSPDYEGLKRKFGITDSAPGYWRMRKRYLAFITKPEVHSEQSFIDAQLGKSAPQHTRPDCSHTVGYSDCERCILESLLRAWARTRDAEREVTSGQAEAHTTAQCPQCWSTSRSQLGAACVSQYNDATEVFERVTPHPWHSSVATQKETK